MAKVKAKRQGFFDSQIRKVDDVFECPTEAQFSTKWMELLEGESFDKPKKKPSRKPKVKVEEQAEEKVEEVTETTEES